MKRLYLYLSAFLILFSVMGSVQAVPLKDLVDENGSIVVGDKRFDSFWWDSSVSNSSFTDYDFDNLLGSIQVTGIDDGGGDIGLGFTTSSLSVTSTGEYEWIDLFFGFKVTVLNPGLRINGVSLGLDDASVIEGGDNGAFIIEKIGTSLGAVNDSSADGDLENLTAELSWLDDDLISDAFDSASLSPRQEIYISKNIIVWADSFGSDFDSVTASLESFSQRFSQDTSTQNIPEPGTWLLMGIGVLGLVFNQKHQKKLMRGL